MIFPMLQQHLDHALAKLESNPEFELRLEDRLPIYAFFDSLSGLKGRMARAYSSTLVTRKVLLVWDDMPDDLKYPTMPSLMLSTVDLLLSHMQAGAGPEELAALASTTLVEIVDSIQVEPLSRSAEQLVALADEMEDLTGQPPQSLYYHAECVFFAAAETLRVALGRERRPDAARWAAIAHAGGVWTADEELEPDEFSPSGTWDYTSDEVRLRRREFWRAWCNEVIPETWAYVQRDETLAAS